jgi:hypothetical protein
MSMLMSELKRCTTYKGCLGWLCTTSQSRLHDSVPHMNLNSHLHAWLLTLAESVCADCCTTVTTGCTTTNAQLVGSGFATGAVPASVPVGSAVSVACDTAEGYYAGTPAPSYTCPSDGATLLYDPCTYSEWSPLVALYVLRVGCPGAWSVQLQLGSGHPLGAGPLSSVTP